MSKFTNDLDENSKKDNITEPTPSLDHSEQLSARKSRENMPMTSSEAAGITTDIFDHRRIILTNVLSFIDQDFLELYIEYLSNEVEIERFDLSKELKDTVVITFENDISEYNQR